MHRIARAQGFRKLHEGPRILVIANAWDAASARVFEQAGVSAIGTGSAGIAFSHGYPDNDRVPRHVILRATREIVEAVKLPVTADILSGLGRSLPDVVATVGEVIAMGAVGVNIEDGTDDGPRLFEIDEQSEKIRAVCQAVKASGVPIVVNARTDSFWLKIGDERECLRASIERANRYREAGADCLFVPSVTDRETIRTLVKEIDGPINILASAGCPPVAELEQLGVRRVSEGSGPMRAAMMLARRIAEELVQKGTYTRFHDDAIPYAEANKLFE
jgi:2-methylisocitrate lyase-like PEP mutase family enzyme